MVAIDVAAQHTFKKLLQRRPMWLYNGCNIKRQVLDTCANLPPGARWYA